MKMAVGVYVQCVFVCMVPMWVFMCAHVYKGQRSTSGAVPPELSTMFLETGSLTCLNLIKGLTGSAG